MRGVREGVGGRERVREGAGEIERKEFFLVGGSGGDFVAQSLDRKYQARISGRRILGDKICPRSLRD